MWHNSRYDIVSGQQPWRGFMRPATPRSKSTRAKDAARAAKAERAFQDWVMALVAKLDKRFVLSTREVAAFLVQR